MKRLLVFFLAPILVMGLATLALLLLTDQPVNTSRRPIVTCPVEAKSDFAKGFGNKWLIWAEDGNVKAPVVQVDQSKSAADGTPFGSVCELTFKAHEPGQGIDWRIGNIAPNAAPFRGKMVQYRFWVKSSLPVELNTGTAYFYDGKTIAGKSVSKIDQNWRQIEITGPVAQDAESFEIWFRLALGEGTIRPESGKIYFAAEVAPSDLPYKPTAAPPPPAPQPFQQHRCVVGLSPEAMALVGEARFENKWTSYRYNGSKPAPDVVVHPDGPSVGKSSSSCRLVFKGAPSEPGDGVDWRIGYLFPNPAAFSGKEVTLRIQLRANAPVALDSGSIYLYDGQQMVQVPLRQIGPEWTEAVVTSRIGAGANQLEGWLRLLLGAGTMVPNAGEIDFYAFFETKH